MEDLTFFLKGIVFSAPYVLIQLVAAVLCLVFRARMPRAWGAAATGFVLLLIGNFSWLVYYAVFTWVFKKADNFDGLETIAIAQGVFQTFVSFVGYLLIMIALLRRREPATGT